MGQSRRSHARSRKLIGLTAALAVGLLLSSSTGFRGASAFTFPSALRLLIVTGGHDFEEAAFFRVFDEMNGITWTHVSFGHGAELKLELENSGAYDVAVFYDMHQDQEPHSREWLQVLEKGKPTVFLHHALGSYVKWEDYGEIVGGRANFGRDVKWAPHTTFQHDVSFRSHCRSESPDH